MGTRVTQRMLEKLVERINIVTESPLSTYGFNADNKVVSNIDNFYLDYAYGGVKLVRVVNDSGGIKTISPHGYGTKRQLYDWMDSFLIGYAYTGRK